MRSRRADLPTSIARAGRLIPTVVSAAIGLAVIAVPLAAGVRFDFIDVTLLLHLSMVVTLGGAVFTLDDPAIAMTRVLPVSAARVAVAKMAMALAVLTPSWVLQLVLAPSLVTSSGGYDARGLLIEPLGVLAWIWLVAWRRVNRSADGSGAAAAAPALFLGAVAVGFLPAPLALFVNPADPAFAQSRLRWLALLAVGAGWLVVELSRSTGPGRRALSWRRQPG